MYTYVLLNVLNNTAKKRPKVLVINVEVIADRQQVDSIDIVSLVSTRPLQHFQETRSV